MNAMNAMSAPDNTLPPDSDRARSLQLTPLLAFNQPVVQSLIDQRGWRSLDQFERIGAVYAFVRDEIGLATTPASRALLRTSSLTAMVIATRRRSSSWRC